MAQKLNRRVEFIQGNLSKKGLNSLNGRIRNEEPPQESKIVVVDEKEYFFDNANDVKEIREMLNTELYQIVMDVKAKKERAEEIRTILRNLPKG